jgi:hypothetical protein
LRRKYYQFAKSLLPCCIGATPPPLICLAVAQ